jgi:hypothetical protein
MQEYGYKCPKPGPQSLAHSQGLLVTEMPSVKLL